MPKASQLIVQENVPVVRGGIPAVIRLLQPQPRRLCHALLQMKTSTGLEDRIRRNVNQIIASIIVVAVPCVVWLQILIMTGCLRHTSPAIENTLLWMLFIGALLNQV